MVEVVVVVGLDLDVIEDVEDLEGILEFFGM